MTLTKSLIVTNLNLQDVITAEALVMHLIIRIISISFILILDESEAGVPKLATWLFNVISPGIHTYSRLEEDRGAGMSQRTRRP